MRSLVFILVASATIVGCSEAENTPTTAQAPYAEEQSMAANKARDPQRAVEEEFAKAERENTVAAWQLFIARHPDNVLTKEAKRRLANLN